MERLVYVYRASMVALCKQTDLTPPQFWALKTIERLQRTKMSPLAEELGLSMGAASTLVDRLVSRGFVERTADATDRRAVHVSLSEQGRRVLTEAKEGRQAQSRQIFDQLGPAVRPQLLVGLGALIQAWEAMPTELDPDGPCGI
jgi:DNA-binding MarR family transcriptional regulator